MTSLAPILLRCARLSLWTVSVAVLPLCSAVGACADTPVLAPVSPFPTLGMLAAGDEVVLPLRGIVPLSTPAMQSGAPSSAGGQHPRGQIKGLRYKSLETDVNGNIKASGGVELIYTDPETQKQTTVIAEEFTYDAATGQAEAHGSVLLKRDEANFSGQNLSYNFQRQTGTVADGIVLGNYFTLRGKKITANGDGTYLVEQGEYTTCIRSRPDYKLRANRLTVKPGEYVSARGVTFYAGSTRLITLPSYHANLKTSHGAPVPLPGYNKTDGVFVRVHDTPIAEPHRSVDYDARIGVRHLPIGLVGYVTDIAPPAFNSPPPRIYLNTLIDPLRGILEQITPPTYTEYTESSFRDQFSVRSTFDAVFQNNQGVYNRSRTDLTLTRAEVAIRFINILGNWAHSMPSAGKTAEPVLGNTEAVLQRVPNAPFLLDANLVASEIHEMPTNITAGRISFHSALASQPLIIGRRVSLRAGISNWFRAYTTGTLHDLTSPEIAMDYVPTRTSRVGVAYRYVSTVGKTPFAFDARDIRNELRLQYQVSGPWAFGIITKINLDRSRDYDTEVAVLRNFDCMQVGINYRVRSQSFNIIFNLLPPTADRARSRQMPLNPGPKVGLNRQTTPIGLNPNAVTAFAVTE